MNKPHDVWLKTDEEKLISLRGDIAKSQLILDNIEACLRQLKAKNRFQLALTAQLQESMEQTNNKENK